MCGTIPESNASVVVSLDTCRHVAHSRTHPYHSDLRVGNSSPTIVNNGMAIINRETLHRPGPHPHRSTFISFKPHAIIMHQTKFIPLTAGYFNQFYSTTIEFMYRNMFVNCGSRSCELQEIPGKRCYRENAGASDSSSEYFIISRRHRTGDAPRRSVCELVAISGQSSWGRSRHADFRSRPLVFGGMDWWSRCGLPCGFGICSNSSVKLLLQEP